MQNHTKKILVLLLFVNSHSIAQVSNYRLLKADSLFEAKRYTSALAQYEGVITNKEYSPSLLLKMAYIHEALGHIAKTQYFLSLYFLSANDDSVLAKMEELAAKFKLKGYETNDGERALFFYKRFQQTITFSLISLLVLCQAWMVYKKRVTGKRPITAFVLLISICGLLGTHLYSMSSRDTSILMQPNTYLMSGPSAGADVVEVLDEGHRLTVTGKKDVWLKVKWNDKDAFVKEGFLQPITL